MDKQHDSSLLFVKHRRHPEQTFNRNVDRNLGLSHGEEIHLTAQYITSLSNQTADWESQNYQDNREWKPCPAVFKQTCNYLGKPLLDLLISKLCHKLLEHIIWQPDPQGVVIDAFQKDLKYQFLCTLILTLSQMLEIG